MAPPPNAWWWPTSSADLPGEGPSGLQLLLLPSPALPLPRGGRGDPSHPASRPAAPSPPWADLPVDIVGCVAHRLLCIADRVRLSATCRPWRAAQPPPPLPCLVLPYHCARCLPGQITSRAALFCLGCNATHLPNVGAGTVGVRCFGSHPGGWVFMSFGLGDRHSLVHLRSGQCVGLPDTIAGNKMVMLAAALSAPPLLPSAAKGSGASARDPPLCAAIVSCVHNINNVAFWHLGSDHVLQSARVRYVTDHIFYRDGFYFLTANRSLHAFALQNDLSLARTDFLTRPCDGKRSSSLDNYLKSWPRGNYLVVSRGDILLVERTAGPDLTCSFRVFRARPQAGVQLDWVELTSLDGRLLFVARGCSRSYESADFPGVPAGLYFTDDYGGDDVMMITDDDDQERRFQCKDNGSWVEEGDLFRHWFPRHCASNYSGPTWLFH